ncbi:RidA family protein [Flavivirga aquimarina]|uniref:RidA family protein n=1 Tax=Flavivirga aquimarina TaxID=2027862 RepID=A0ABT8WE42_9FLAO|nr:RidA family protein [Flavivirga aquimarina]MDO5971434.1 RidA family protein [Flavivirga aquimarina]
MNIKEKLNALNLELPSVSTPGGSYVSVNIRGSIVYVAIQFPIINGALHYKGRLGAELTTEDGYKGMQMCALNVIAQINEKVGLENIVGLNHLDAYYQSYADWNEAPEVVNGASDLFLDLLGDKGTHSRAIFGVDKLYSNLSVGLTCTFTINK